MSSEFLHNNQEPLTTFAKAQKFLDQNLIPSLSQGVTRAEQERQRGNHQAVHQYFDSWIGKDQNGQQTLEETISFFKRAVTSETESTLKVDLAKAGFAGLGRIEHVDANSEYKEIKDALRLKGRVDQVSELYKRLNPESLVPWTIHGEGIYWPAEIAQDLANTQILLGDRRAAEETIREALRQISQVNLEVGEIDLQTPEETLKKADYASFRARKKYLGAFSAKGVLWYRMANLDKNLSYMRKALKLIHLAHIKEPNSHRLATVAYKLDQASISPDFRGSLKERILGILDGNEALMEALMSSPKDTISALKQAFREKG